MSIITIATIRHDPEVFNKYLKPCVDSLSGDFEFIIEDTHTLPAECYNRIINKSKNDYIVFIHADVQFSSTFIQDIEKSISAKQDFGAMGFAGIGINKQRVSYRTNVNEQYEMETLDGLGILINRAHGLKFDSKNFDELHLYVDDYCCQVRFNLNLKVWTILTPRVYHHGATWRKLGGHWGTYPQYKTVLETKWGRTIRTT